VPAQTAMWSSLGASHLSSATVACTRRYTETRVCVTVYAIGTLLAVRLGRSARCFCCQSGHNSSESRTSFPMLEKRHPVSSINRVTVHADKLSLLM
jgi:hypothetical protein